MSDLAEQLEKLARKDLQRIAKSIGVKANGKTADIIALLEGAYAGDPSTFTNSAEVTELLPDLCTAAPSQPCPPAAPSPLPAPSPLATEEPVASTIPDVDVITATDNTLQDNPLFDEPSPAPMDTDNAPQPQPMDTSATPGAVHPANKENSTPAPPTNTATANSTPFTEEAMRRAYEKGRKSGLWQGAAEVGLKELEKQWDDVKAKPAIRGWTLPSMSDVKAKSTALKASGFTTVGSPARGGTTNLKKPSRLANAARTSQAGNGTPSRLARPSVKTRTPGKSHVDRAKEAEEAFKARRAAALAKSRVAR